MSYSSDRISSAFHQVQKDVATLLNPKTYEHLSQNQIIGALTVLLLVVGVSVGIYLGGQSQEIRQQAAYPGCICTATSGGNCSNGTKTPDVTCSSGFSCCGIIATNTPAQCYGVGQICDDKRFCCPGTKCLPLPNGYAGTCVSTSEPTVTPDPNIFCPDVGGACRLGLCEVGETQVNGKCDNGGLCCKLSNNCQVAGGVCTFNVTGQCPAGTVIAPDKSCPQPVDYVCCMSVATNTPVPRNTNTPVPNTPGQPTNTPVPNPTNTSVPNTPRPTNTPGGPTNTPRPTNTVTPTYTPGGPTITPTNTPVIAPVCVNVTLNNPAASVPNTPPKIGDIVTMTCSQVAGATRYEFRVKLPNGSYVSVDPSLTTPYVSQQLTISTAGVHVAACRPCATVDSTSCAPWEN